MKVINLTRLTQFVGVRHKDGKEDSVRIVPRGRIDLRDGMLVDVRWQQLNPDTIQVIADPAPLQSYAASIQSNAVIVPATQPTEGA